LYDLAVADQTEKHARGIRGRDKCNRGALAFEKIDQAIAIEQISHGYSYRRIDCVRR
jgi:hypothetical protein